MRKAASTARSTRSLKAESDGVKSGLTKVVQGKPSAPLEGYFTPEIWKRAEALAEQDANEEADVVIAARNSVDTGEVAAKWAEIRAQRDRQAEKFRRDQSRRPRKVRCR